MHIHVITDKHKLWSILEGVAREEDQGTVTHESVSKKTAPHVSAADVVLLHVRASNVFLATGMIKELRPHAQRLMVAVESDEQTYLEVLFEVGADMVIEQSAELNKQTLQIVYERAKRLASRPPTNGLYQPKGPVRNPSVVTVGNMTIDVEYHKVIIADRVAEFPDNEFQMLFALARSEGRTLTHEHLFEYLARGGRSTYAVHSRIRNIKKGLAKASAEGFVITSIYGVGYTLRKA